MCVCACTCMSVPWCVCKSGRRTICESVLSTMWILVMELRSSVLATPYLLSHLVSLLEQSGYCGPPLPSLGKQVLWVSSPCLFDFVPTGMMFLLHFEGPLGRGLNTGSHSVARLASNLWSFCLGLLYAGLQICTIMPSFEGLLYYCLV